MLWMLRWWRRQVFRKGHEHSPEAIAARLESGPGHSYLKDSIYGAIDGAVTTFAVISSIAGAGLSSGIIIVLGLANLLADGFSMAASNYLGTRSENQRRAQKRVEEYRAIDNNPQGEQEEIRQIFAAKGFSDVELETVVDVITANRDRWVDTMLQEEYGLSVQPSRALLAGVVTFFAFMLAGALPLLPFLLDWVGLMPGQPFLWSVVITGVAFFLVGAAKAQYVDQAWYWSGLEILLIGGTAALLAYVVGLCLKGFVV